MGTQLTDKTFVFSGHSTPDHSEPYSPDAVTQRYESMAERAGIDTHLHALRHFSATELLTTGIDAAPSQAASATAQAARRR